ncbi:hypothetical protein [Cellulomonas uda]|uniref:DUF7847 domain-containing protein n=1 Tax=Cellulomonas uda TaxID=1714 RepID=A0A4Y3KCL6_CELUD|nr:hypothetical protein [Cellulomonas uda]NII65444.1 putative membrane protein [Cellulomonas uda]GEA80620.1 hypothetical protein CUD01_10640 [Cellulomonas uda]
MSDTTPRPDDGSNPVPPGPQEPTPPAPEGAYPPPPAGAYPPPPAGATPPPPGGYPPPPAPGGYGGDQSVDVVEGFKWGWKKFTENLSPILIAIVAYVVGSIVVIGIWYFVIAGLFLRTSETTIDDEGNITFGSGPGFAAVLLSTALISVVAVLVLSIVQAGFVQGALRISRGEALTVDTFFKFRNLPAVILASLLVAVLTAVGYALCYLPGIVVAFFAQFTLYYVVDRGSGAVDALKASFQLVRDNIVPALLIFLGVALASAVGGLVCGVGTLVTLPVALLAQTYVYRRLNREPVVP